MKNKFNVKEHAPLSVGASVDHGAEVKTTEDHRNRAADRGCVARLVVPLSFVGRDEYDTFKSIVRLYGLEKAIEIVKGFRKHQREHPNAYSEGEYAAFSESNFNLEAAIASNSKTSMTEVPSSHTCVLAATLPDLCRASSSGRENGPWTCSDASA
jgi:hypothetical protein